MPAIHLVERVNNVKRLPAPGEWESGYWFLSEESAEKLVGGDIYLHTGQQDASHFGGTILGYRVEQSGSDTDGKIVFRFAATMEHKGVFQREGWGQEKSVRW